MTITHGNGIDWSTIHTHALGVIRFGNKNNRYRTRTKAFTDITFHEEILYLPVDFLGVVGVGAVCVAVRKWCAGYEVDPVLNAS